jgi:hypothetical protein
LDVVQGGGLIPVEVPGMLDGVLTLMLPGVAMRDTAVSRGVTSA